jgi:hyperosmotically inducible periplasmic protein
MSRIALALAFLLAASACEPKPPKPKTAEASAALVRVRDINPQTGTEAKRQIQASPLTSAVKSALAADAGLKMLKINVDSDAATGKVTLKGRVKSEEEKNRAEAVAKKVEGVKTVENRLTVQATKG